MNELKSRTAATPPESVLSLLAKTRDSPMDELPTEARMLFELCMLIVNIRYRSLYGEDSREQ
ncbi:hypothetical protein JNJ66_06140 [Candidatus Saccharibacteria bacterium]|nr:hypothetical protein [Candidatus Saccharibacteria bacterium]